ncbi:hypothetical protein [Kitasatospora sp. NPDC085879]|uniref:hypothetical protein n=1 Tax=Kitasatospora sp. NPDC085879 TaxID=3154769 RepID=UPI00341A0DEF
MKRWQWWMMGLWMALMLSSGLTVFFLGKNADPAPLQPKCPAGQSFCAFGSAGP